MSENIKEYIKELDKFKRIHNFKYSEVAKMLNVTTRSLHRWIKGDYLPLPIYREKIIELIKTNKK